MLVMIDAPPPPHSTFTSDVGAALNNQGHGVGAKGRCIDSFGNSEGRRPQSYSKLRCVSKDRRHLSPKGRKGLATTSD